VKDRWEIGKWFGIPVSMHWTVLLWLPWLFLFMRDLVAALIAIPAVFFLLISHELGHVFAARRRKVYVQRIDLMGLHGETVRAEARNERDEVFVAWGGVLAQLLILAIALVIRFAVDLPPWSWFIAGPLLSVLIDWNIFFIIVALLPIGPMDGHMAWKVFKLKPRKASPKPKVTPPPAEPTPEWTPEEEQAMKERSEKIAADLLKQLGGKK
jgi:Zn-dependent protease